MLPGVTPNNTTTTALACDGGLYWGYGNFTAAGHGDYWALIEWYNTKTLIYVPTMPEMSYLHAATNETRFRFTLNANTSTSQVLYQLFGGGIQQGTGDYNF